MWVTSKMFHSVGRGLDRAGALTGADHEFAVGVGAKIGEGREVRADGREVRGIDRAALTQSLTVLSRRTICLTLGAPVTA